MPTGLLGLGELSHDSHSVTCKRQGTPNAISKGKQTKTQYIQPYGPQHHSQCAEVMAPLYTNRAWYPQKHHGDGASGDRVGEGTLHSLCTTTSVIRANVVNGGVVLLHCMK